MRAPALRLEKREVAVVVSEALGADWEGLAEAAGQRFCETTGYRLRLVQPGEKGPPPPAEAPDEAWEINRAYAEIRGAFQGEQHTPYRIGLKSDAGGSYIETAFISPAVGGRYRDLLERLSARIGWSIRVRESANQEQLAQEARRITSEACTVRCAPRFFAGEGRVVMPVVQAPDEAEQETLREAFREATGFEIEWEEAKRGRG